MLEMLAASPDYQMLCELVVTSEGLPSDMDASDLFDAICEAAAGFSADSMAAQLAESLGLRFAD